MHWAVAGIHADTTSVPEGTVPAGAVVVREYLGPCPPSGTHTRADWCVAGHGGWSGRRESNPHCELGKLVFYH